MNKFTIRRKWIPIFVICGAFIFCAAIGMVINFDAFNKFISLQQLSRAVPPKLPHRSYYWDVEHYARMARNLKCTAFYPLWSFIVHNLFHPRTLDQAAYYLRQLSAAIFITTIPPLFWAFKQGLNRSLLASLIVLAYALNPMSIFHVIGYTETLFAALSVALIWACLDTNKTNGAIKLLILFLATCLMSLTRPILIQVVLASAATIATILGFALMQSERSPDISNLTSFIKKYLRDYSREIRLTAVLCLAAIIGYSIYGVFCLSSRGDFFAPFSDQRNWGKQLGLHLSLLLLPRSPLIDLLGLYFPLILWGIAIALVYQALIKPSADIWVLKAPAWNVLLLYPPAWIVSYGFIALRACQGKPFFQRLLERHSISPYAATLHRNYLFWFCIYFSLTQAAIVFFTQNRLNSLSRYTFAIPFFFLALGYVCRCLPKKQVYPLLGGLIVLSAIALIQQWVLYGQDKWLG